MAASAKRVHGSRMKNKTELPEPEWYIEAGLRKVKPYVFQFNTFTKERWRDRTILDIFSTDFRDRSPAYYETSIAAGTIKVNGKIITKDYVVRNGDQITNMIHRHEPPVAGDPVRILYKDEEKGLLVVEKPGSMPVHPTGRYNYNTLLSILKYDYKLTMVHTLNRLDRLTSGIMVTATNAEATKSLAKYFGTEGAVKKEYVARCIGNFTDEEVTCDKPLLTIDRQIGLNVIHPQGRHAATIFRKLSYDAKTNSSVVHCRPITGRSHQIRVHLQYLGHPILNDPIYSNVDAWGEGGGHGGIYQDAFNSSPPSGPTPATLSQVQPWDSPPASHASLPVAKKLGRGAMQSLISLSPSDTNPESAESSNSSSVALNAAATQAVLALRRAKDEEDGGARERDQNIAKRIGVEGVGAVEGEQLEGYCEACGLPMLPDPKPEALYIYLHALRYQTDTWDFSSELPKWAAETDWVP